MMMPGSRLKIGFHDNEKTPEQILIIPFRDGDKVKYFVVRGVRGGRQAHNKMRHGQDNGLGSADRISRGFLGEMWDAMLFKLKAAETSMP